MKTVFALVDCNNFFVSCERLFRPDLEGKPVVVFSSNDACIVARSNEAKALGVPMGQPVFKFRDILRHNQVAHFSANFELYGNISKRITQILGQITPRIEVYSVDESFLDLSHLRIDDYEAWGRAARSRIWKEVGVPVSIGIGSSKTLAKLGAEIAKKQQRGSGIFDFIAASNAERQAILDRTAIGDLWGIGWRLAPKLRAEGIGTAGKLAYIRPQLAQQLMGIHGRQLVSELRGVACHPLEPEGKVIQSIMRSRTFGEDTNQAHVLEAAIATLGSQAAFRLRNNGLLCRRIGLFMTTSRHKPGYRRWVPELTLDTPTNDSGLIITLLIKEMASLFSNKQSYHRLGVFLHDFVPENQLQTDLLGYVDTAASGRSQSRMRAMDTINARLGRGTIYYAAEDLSDQWRPKVTHRSPRYVSHWNELPVARITPGIIGTMEQA